MKVEKEEVVLEKLQTELASSSTDSMILTKRELWI